MEPRSGLPSRAPKGTLIGGPHTKEYSILGSMLGYPNFGKVPNRHNEWMKNWVAVKELKLNYHNGNI